MGPNFYDFGLLLTTLLDTDISLSIAKILLYVSYF